jgi:cation transport regulator ChaC
MSFVFQYGSNCNTHRLNRPNRLDGHAADRGRAETVEDYEIAFDVFSKGNGCAAADLIEAAGTGRKAWGVLYDIPDDFIRGPRSDGQKTLERIEGNRYTETPIRVRDRDGVERDAVTFVVKPEERTGNLSTTADYVAHIVKGLRAHDVPETYIQRVIDIALATNLRTQDPSQTERQRIENLRKDDPAKLGP